MAEERTPRPGEIIPVSSDVLTRLAEQARQMWQSAPAGDGDQSWWNAAAQQMSGMTGVGGAGDLGRGLGQPSIRSAWNPPMQQWATTTSANSAVGFRPHPFEDLFTMPAGSTATVTVDDQQRAHSLNGKPAVVLSTGESCYAWHGVRVHDFVITQPERITPRMIEAEPNAEIRRVMIEVYGAQRYLHDCGAEMMHRDECGELYRKRPTFAGEEDIWFVKVKNATPEPDGTFKDYFLRVPPRTIEQPGMWGLAAQGHPFKTAREAVAWTFRVDPKDYKPTAQS